MKTKLINLTPHDVTIVGSNGQTVTIPANWARAPFPRVVERRLPDQPLITREGHTIPLEMDAGMPFVTIADLPDPEPDTVYIVPTMIRQSRPGRGDLVSPGDLVRDTEGTVIGCRCLVSNPT